MNSRLRSIPAAWWPIGLFVGLMGHAPLLAAEVEFNIAPADFAGQTTITVSPSTTVAYVITAEVFPSQGDTPDSSGLAFFSVGISTDLGASQAAASAFGTDVDDAFSQLRSLGTPAGDTVEDDIQEIGASQPTADETAALLADVGIGQAVTLATGVLAMPTTPGTYQVTVLEPLANVFAMSDLGTVVQATTRAGAGFTIEVNDGSNSGTDDNAEDDTGDTTDQGQADRRDGESFAVNAITIAASAALIIGAALLAGPIGAAVALVIMIMLAILLVLF